eukprot:scpid102619/ scgid28029/ 
MALEIMHSAAFNLQNIPLSKSLHTVTHTTDGVEVKQYRYKGTHFCHGFRCWPVFQPIPPSRTQIRTIGTMMKLNNNRMGNMMRAPVSNLKRIHGVYSMSYTNGLLLPVFGSGSRLTLPIVLAILSNYSKCAKSRILGTACMRICVQ